MQAVNQDLGLSRTIGALMERIYAISSLPFMKGWIPFTLIRLLPPCNNFLQSQIFLRTGQRSPLPCRQGIDTGSCHKRRCLVVFDNVPHLFIFPTSFLGLFSSRSFNGCIRHDIPRHLALNLIWYGGRFQPHASNNIILVNSNEESYVKDS